MPRELDCPKCPASPMERVKDRALSLDECPRCGGRWYDFGELEASVKDPAAFRAAAAAGPIKSRPGDAMCPHCHQAMTNGGLVNEFLRADFCPACKGFWLDKNEIRLLDSLL